MRAAAEQIAPIRAISHDRELYTQELVALACALLPPKWHRWRGRGRASVGAWPTQGVARTIARLRCQEPAKGCSHSHAHSQSSWLRSQLKGSRAPRRRARSRDCTSPRGGPELRSCQPEEHPKLLLFQLKGPGKPLILEREGGRGRRKQGWGDAPRPEAAPGRTLGAILLTLAWWQDGQGQSDGLSGAPPASASHRRLEPSAGPLRHSPLVGTALIRTRPIHEARDPRWRARG